MSRYTINISLCAYGEWGLSGFGSFLLLEQHWQYIWGNKNKLLLQLQRGGTGTGFVFVLAAPYLLLLWVLPQCLPLTLH